jgi:hypothetical protein
MRRVIKHFMVAKLYELMVRSLRDGFEVATI